MTISEHPITNTSCADFLHDLVVHRLSWLTYPQLIEIAKQAGFNRKRVQTQIRRSWTMGMLYRGIRNVPPAGNAVCWYDSRRPMLDDAAIRRYASDQTIQQQMPAEVTELISIGPLAAGLLGVRRPIEPNFVQLTAGQRLATAFKTWLAMGIGPDQWQQVNSRQYLAHLAAVAQISSPCGVAKRFVFAPISMNQKRLRHFFKKVNELQVPYELW